MHTSAINQEKIFKKFLRGDTQLPFSKNFLYYKNVWCLRWREGIIYFTYKVQGIKPTFVCTKMYDWFLAYVIM